MLIFSWFCINKWLKCSRVWLWMIMMMLFHGYPSWSYWTRMKWRRILWMGWVRSHGAMIRYLVGRMELNTIKMGDRYKTRLPLNDPQSSKIYKKLLQSELTHVVFWILLFDQLFVILMDQMLVMYPWDFKSLPSLLFLFSQLQENIPVMYHMLFLVWLGTLLLGALRNI